MALVLIVAEILSTGISITIDYSVSVTGIGDLGTNPSMETMAFASKAGCTWTISLEQDLAR